MADMARADDIFVATGLIDLNPAAAVFYLLVPRACKLVKLSSVKGEAFTGAAEVTVSSSYGDLTDTLSLATAETAGTIDSVDVREEANNQFAAGTLLTLTSDGTPSAQSRAHFALVLRPL